MRRELERIEIPGEHEARVRTWAIVREAFAEREPAPPERHRMRLAVVIAVAAAVLAAALSPPGRAVLGEIREAVGVERAQRGLFSLPADGRLLVAADSGVMGRAAGRLEAAARGLPGGELVAVRALRRDGEVERAGRARAGRGRSLDAGPPTGVVPALGGLGRRHAHRLPLGRSSSGRRR